MTLNPGPKASVTLEVSPGDTAVALGSGDVAVLGTPRVVALAEEATVAAVAGGLESSETSVGTRVEIDHLAPTPVGAVVVATAVLDGVNGRHLSFAVEVTQEDQVVARGRINRVVVDRARFTAAAAES